MRQQAVQQGRVAREEGQQLTELGPCLLAGGSLSALGLAYMQTHGDTSGNRVTDRRMQAVLVLLSVFQFVLFLNEVL